MVTTTKEKLYEIKVKKVTDLSPEAQTEVRGKLLKLPESFNFQGYAKVTYTHSSPLEAISVDPIEGTILDLFKSITKECNINK